MSFYIEIENWNKSGPKTFLVSSFNAASKVVKKGGPFTNDVYEPDPKATRVEFLREGDQGRAAISTVVIAIGYEEFKQKLVEAQKTNTIPSFSRI